MNKDVQIQKLLSEIASLREVTNIQAKQIAEQSQKISELEKRLKKNSRNSSKPPSSDGLSKPPRTQSLRKKGKNPSGGQKDHPGHTLNQVDTPDKIESHPLNSCPHCDSDLSKEAILKTKKRQVFDIPKPELFVTEYQTETKWCANCAKRVHSSFPASVNAPVQYGKRIKALALYFQHEQLLPEDRLQALFKDVWGVSITTATLNAYSLRAYHQLSDFNERLLNVVKQAKLKHLDETGFRVNGKTQWLHVASTNTLTYYHRHPKRKSLLDNLSGIVVHDHWKSYYQLLQVKHALCNAHPMRELVALISHEKEPWANSMKRVFSLCLGYRYRYSDSPIPEKILERLLRYYSDILKKGFAYHERLPPLKQKKRGSIKRRTGHNLLIRFQVYQEDVLRFLFDPNVPFTNNQAERDLRMMKCKQKISGGFRTEMGADVFIRIRGFISTARKQTWDIVNAIESLVDGSPPLVGS